MKLNHNTVKRFLDTARCRDPKQFFAAIQVATAFKKPGVMALGFKQSLADIAAGRPE